MFQWKLNNKKSSIKIGKCTLYNADNMKILKKIPDNSLEVCFTDPPYGLTQKTDIKSILLHWLNDIDYVHTKKGFMSKGWDGCVPGPIFWKECYRVLKPGAHMMIFGGPRTVDLLTISLRLAGFEIRDVFMFLHGVGFPKGQDLGQSIQKKLQIGSARRPDRELGLTRNRWNGGKEGLAQTGGAIELTFEEAKRWKGWNTQIKPAYEPILQVRKPLSEKNIAENVLKWNTGSINIDDCRIGNETRSYDLKGGENLNKISRPSGNDSKNAKGLGAYGVGAKQISIGKKEVFGRYPANVIWDGSEELQLEFYKYGETKSSGGKGKKSMGGIGNNVFGKYNLTRTGQNAGGLGDSGSISRFFYSPKVSTKEKGGSKHPTQKNLTMLEYFVKMVTPPGGTILDPFMGSNSTGIAASRLGFNYIGIEQDPEEFQGAIRKTRFHLEK